ncbi:hypothetical protein GS597_01005 [Synechococcales cyanobacterium C]|uniref:Isopropylmalate/homocitrate/citramalate synthases n=1 Tax=Petrachloros mirabilis ULC683 TaxID=2781853 RepID=A0A8K1ZWF2_9CYAN|nr:hypothetical protein [Petrachloros mirabilis ULC683]
MSEPNHKAKDDFLYPRSTYRGNFTPENLVFNANLQEFAQKIGYICALETSGKVPPDAAYEEIKKLWKELKVSKRELGIQSTPPPDSNQSE